MGLQPYDAIVPLLYGVVDTEDSNPIPTGRENDGLNPPSKAPARGLSATPEGSGLRRHCRQLIGLYVNQSSRSISVVVPTFRRCRKLMRLLTSFEGLESDHLKEVIVVDDCSDDDTRAAMLRWIERHHEFDGKYIRTTSNHGPAWARNIGLKAATGDFVAFTDDDCVADSRWLTNLVKPLDVANGTVGAGGSVLPLSRHVAARYYTFHHILEPAPSMLYLVTANCCYDRNSALSVGGFDTDLSTPGGEDVALSFKLYRQGYRFQMARDAIIYHDYRRGFVDFYRTFFNYGRGCRHVTEKYFGNGEGRDDETPLG